MLQRNISSFQITEASAFKQRMLSFANSFDVCCYLESNQYPDKYHSHDCLLAFGAEHIFSPEKNILPKLKAFLSQHKDWLFGHVNYDLKNEIASLTSTHEDWIGFPEIFLFHPKIVIECRKNEAVISCIGLSPQKIFSEIENLKRDEKPKGLPVELTPRISKENYLSVIRQLQKHILRGDCYEINFCQEFFSENAVISPLEAYHKLSSVSPAPFSAFYKVNDKYLFCASPERYFKKTGNKIVAQPIKGTLRRDTNDKVKDRLLSEQLHNSAKDRSENVMIVDLVRNDLSKICKEGSVKVDELFGIYGFPQVYQMISTVEGELHDGVDFSDVLKATFPMGSMTGAPKRKVMELIEKYEQSKRGIYSGCLGYISPNGDLDFNVVIRSLMYNATEKYLGCHTGSAITFYSNAEEEYEECLLKAQAMQEALL